VTGPTVFVIDDQKAVRDSLCEMLSVFGFRVEAYASADSFLTAMRNPQVGCVVADVRMPGTDGIALVRELICRRIRLPVVLISGHADVPMAVAGIKAGAEDFIEKPIDDTQLVAAINRGLTRTFSEQFKQEPSDHLTAQFARLTPREV
jgi:two-component system, LuxR family, response regulator FixJ